MKNKLLIAGLFSLSFISCAVNAKVTPEEAQKLGTSLTPMGAQMEGNAAGTIPAWTGGLTSKNGLKSKDPGRPDNPFAEDKLTFVIDSSNFEQYKDNLSPGQLAMFKKYPSYKMPIYETKRTAAYPSDMYDIIKKNALNAELIEGGNGLSGFDTTIPFPIPATANEVIWNHITRYRGGSAERMLTAIPVQSDGSFVEVKLNDQLVWPECAE